MKTVKVAAAVICDSFDEKRKIFATARGYGDYKGWWEFPGGKVEADESPEQALVREIREELDTEIRVVEHIKTIEYEYPAFHLVMDCFWCAVEKGELVLKEAEAAKWLSREQLRDVKWLPSDLEILDIIAEQMCGPKPRVAFVCVHNSCRSQIAEALGKHLAADVFESYSAGTETKPRINQDAVRLMKELYGIDMEETQYSKLLSKIPEVDVVITMGCNVACPSLPCKRREDWGLEDPTGKSDAEFLKVIQSIEEKVLRLKEELDSRESS